MKRRGTEQVWPSHLHVFHVEDWPVNPAGHQGRFRSWGDLDELRAWFDWVDARYEFLVLAGWPAGEAQYAAANAPMKAA